MASWTFVVTYFLGILNLVGNGLVIYLTATRKKLQSLTNAFIMSLAAADFCVAVFIPPSSYASSILSEPQGLRIFTSFQYFLFYASACNSCVVTADRYVSLTLPLRYVTCITWNRVYSLIFPAWVIPFVVYLFPLAWIFASSPENRNICDKFFRSFLVNVSRISPMRRHGSHHCEVQFHISRGHSCQSFSSAI